MVFHSSTLIEYLDDCFLIAIEDDQVILLDIMRTYCNEHIQQKVNLRKCKILIFIEIKVQNLFYPIQQNQYIGYFGGGA